MSNARLAKLERALSSSRIFDALEKVRGLVPDDGTGVQEVVVHAFACILETDSAGLSILFDRFDEDELRRVHASLESIGATRTLTALRKLEKARPPGAQRIDRQSGIQVEEMQQKLLVFCKAHVEELAAG